MRDPIEIHGIPESCRGESVIFKYEYLFSCHVSIHMRFVVTIAQSTFHNLTQSVTGLQWLANRKRLDSGPRSDPVVLLRMGKSPPLAPRKTDAVRLHVHAKEAGGR